MFNMKKVLNGVTAVTLVVSTVLSSNVFAGETNAKHPQITKAQLEAFRKEDARKWAEIDKKYKGKNGRGSYIKETGMIVVTKDGSSGSFVGHAGIMLDKRQIVEAMPDNSGTTIGVDCGVFLSANNWDEIRSSCYESVPKNTDLTDWKTATNWCSNQKGKHYIHPLAKESLTNWRHMRDKFYCSHLVWA